MHDWLKQWPALALACGLPLGKDGIPRIPSPSQQCKRRRAAGAPVHESLFVLTVLQAMRRRLIGARDLIIDSVPILAVSDAVIPMLPLGMLPLSIRVPCYWAIGCIPYSVVVQDSPSSFSCLLPMSMMLLLHNHC